MFLKINSLGGGGEYHAHCFVNLNNKVKHFFCYFKIGHAKFKPFSKSAKMLYFTKH